MSIEKLIYSGLMAMTLALASIPARAGIPVIDATSVAQQIQQVVSWGQQLQQMSNSLTVLQQQFTQMQSMTSKLDGGRGLGTVQNDPNIQAQLPPEIRSPDQLLINPSALSTSDANISAIRAAFGVGTGVDVSAGTSAADGLGRAQAILASSQLRQVQLQALAGRVDTSADAKASLDLLNRNTLESASVNNQMIQTVAALEAAKRAEDLRNKARQQQFSAGFKAGGSAPIITYAY